MPATSDTGAEPEARYRGLLEAAPDSMVVVDQAGRIVLLNLQTERQFGYRRDELVGELVTRIIPEGFAERLIADDLRSPADALAQQIGTGIELVGCRRDGTEFPMEIMLSHMESADGILVTAAIRDISLRKKAEAELRGQAQLLDLARDAIVVRDPANRISYWSKGAESTYGWTAEEAIGWDAHQLFRTVFPVSQEATDVSLSVDGEWAGELGHTARDGRFFTVESSQSVERDDQGQIRAILEIDRDITVRKGAEAILRGQARLLDLARDAIIVRDARNRITYWSKGAEATYGWTDDEVMGLDKFAVLKTTFPVSRADVETRLETTGDWSGELGHTARDGRMLTVESRQSVERDDQGHIHAILEINRDISARKTAEMHLVQMEARYRGLLEAAPDAMVVVNQAGKIVLLNLQAEKQFGYQRDELIDQPVTNIIPKGFAERLIADDLRSAADAIAQQMENGTELIGLRKDGTEFPIEIMLSPLESDQGILVTAAIRNISRRKEAEGQLLQAQKLESIGRLAGGIAHDFNNMLFVIHGYAELLTEDLAPKNRVRLDPGDALLSVIAITNAADRATALTAQLLAFSRQQVIKPRVLDLNLVIADLEPMVRQLIGENMQLAVQLDEEAGNILGDPGQLDQVIVNLVVNARDAMPNGGTVTIETRSVAVDEPYAASHFGVKPGPFLLLSVTDTGVGMDLATRQRLFEPFFTTKQLGKGTGLGLATTYGIVRQAGGFIWVYSEPGMGSSFKLYFPKVDAPASSAIPKIATARDVGTGTVLVVEDERAVREMTTLLLTRVGYDVVAVASAAEAMIRLETLAGIVEVLITDVIMPETSGITLAEWAMDRFPQVGVVLLSGYTAETLDVDKVTARGAAFVSKPVTSGQLLLAVQQSRELRQVNQAPEVEPQ